MAYIQDIADQLHAELGDLLPNDARYQPLARIYAVLVLAKGTKTTMVDVHDAWTAWCEVDDPSHRSMIPFTELDLDRQLLDHPYLAAIHKVRTNLDLANNIALKKQAIILRLDETLELMKDPRIREQVLLEMEANGTAQRLREALKSTKKGPSDASY
jgi:hypothetical protein